MTSWRRKSAILARGYVVFDKNGTPIERIEQPEKVPFRVATYGFFTPT